ncbi:MAG: class I SAM-dependent methyltransferase [Pseudomonadota bacterium]
MDENQSDGHFGADIASTYDDEHGGNDCRRVDAAVAVLAELAGGGAALEFAIGTGRIALPLAAQGITVKGIELSRAMIAKLREKSGGDAIDVVVGDMASDRVDGQFSLVFLVFNTINNLTTQDEQVACFANAARHLSDGGRFVVEVAVPPLRRISPGDTALAFDRSDTHWGTDEFDFVSQQFTSHHIWFRAHGPHKKSFPMRYVWPSELDLMARLAGLELESRWEDWAKTPFNGESTSHVSVWRRPTG